MPTPAQRLTAAVNAALYRGAEAEEIDADPAVAAEVAAAVEELCLTVRWLEEADAAQVLRMRGLDYDAALAQLLERD